MANLRNGDFTKLGRFHNFCYIFDIDLLLGIFCSKRTSLVLSGRSRHSAPLPEKTNIKIIIGIYH